MVLGPPGRRLGRLYRIRQSEVGRVSTTFFHLQQASQLHHCTLRFANFTDQSLTQLPAQVINLSAHLPLDEGDLAHSSHDLLWTAAEQQILALHSVLQTS